VPGPRATPEYVREAAAAGTAAWPHLTAASRRCLDEAQRQSRQLDDNHVGTEHIVLGVLAADDDIASLLARNGITPEVFRAQLYEQPGTSPAGRIPMTSRALMILGLALSAAAGDGGAISPHHLMLGVIAESSDWRRRGFDGPHHLEHAATAAGTSLAAIQSLLELPRAQAWTSAGQQDSRNSAAESADTGERAEHGHTRGPCAADRA
jgi:ATP-dependent Clp protease ATP-binding subunit ClpA